MAGAALALTVAALAVIRKNRLSRDFITDRAAGASAGISVAQVLSPSIKQHGWTTNTSNAPDVRLTPGLRRPATLACGHRSASATAPNGRRSSANTSGPFRREVTRSRSNTTHRATHRQARPSVAPSSRRSARPRDKARWPACARRRSGGARRRIRLEQAWLMASRSPAASGMRPLRRPTPRPTSCRARRLRRSCRASSTTCRSGFADSLRANPPTPPDARAA